MTTPAAIIRRHGEPIPPADEHVPAATLEPGDIVVSLRHAEPVAANFRPDPDTVTPSRSALTGVGPVRFDGGARVVRLTWARAGLWADVPAHAPVGILTGQDTRR